MTVLLQDNTLSVPMLLRLITKKPKRWNNITALKGILPKLLIITVTKELILQKIILNQKTSYNLGSLYISDY